MITRVAMLGDRRLSRAWATVLMPSRCGILVYKALTSIVTSIESLGTPLVSLILRMKAPDDWSPWVPLLVNYRKGVESGCLGLIGFEGL